MSEGEVIITQQAEVLKILSEKAILHPDLMKQHFKTFTKLNNKDLVVHYMHEFMEISSYLGFKEFEVDNMAKLVRRIYKEPQKMPLSKLLDLFMVLAQSDYDYKEFDEKTVKFLDDALEYIEEEFKGIQEARVTVESEDGSKKQIEFPYFPSVETENKNYYKVLIPVKS